MQINGVELLFDFDRISFSERFEEAAKEFNGSLGNARNNESDAVFCKKLVPALRRFIDKVWGDGVYDSLKLNADKLSDHLDLYYDILDETVRSKGEQVARYQSRMEKYSPNRAQRRAKK